MEIVVYALLSRCVLGVLQSRASVVGRGQFPKALLDAMFKWPVVAR